MYLSDYLKAECKGHCNFDFVDVSLDRDNCLFIDPSMIEINTDPWSIKAQRLIQTYFDRLFEELRSGTLQSGTLLDHAREQNATKLGYGNGYNGKGKTREGLWESIKKLSDLIHRIPSISCAQDIPVLVDNFAEDNMSDWLTNIMHDLLNSFTAEQMSKWGCPPNGTKTFWTWSADVNDWIEVTRPSWYYNGKELLMVPKWFVRTNYLFKAHQYLTGVIIERMRKEKGWDDLKKIDLWINLPRFSEHWEYDTVIDYTISHPDALTEYHNRIPSYYRRANGCMTDEDLDNAVYYRKSKSIA